MAKITPYNGQEAAVATVNNAVVAVAAKYKANVTVVDLNTGFPNNGSDGLHPNDVGFTWMSDQLYAAIRGSYGDKPSLVR